MLHRAEEGDIYRKRYSKKNGGDHADIKCERRDRGREEYLRVVTAKDLLTSIGRLVNGAVTLVLTGPDTEDLRIGLSQLDKGIVPGHLGSDRSSQIVLSTTIASLQAILGSVNAAGDLDVTLGSVLDVVRGGDEACGEDSGVGCSCEVGLCAKCDGYVFRLGNVTTIFGREEDAVVGCGEDDGSLTRGSRGVDGGCVDGREEEGCDGGDCQGDRGLHSGY